LTGERADGVQPQAGEARAEAEGELSTVTVILRNSQLQSLAFTAGAGALDEVLYNRHKRYRFICNVIRRL
jgi:hypothetical protein